MERFGIGIRGHGIDTIRPMAIENAGNNEALSVGKWSLGCLTAMGFVSAVNKMLRSGPVKELGKRMDKLEASVETRFEALTNQRTLDVDTLKAEVSSVKVALAGLAAETKAQNVMLDRIWKHVEARPN
jgi:hypothetical protein